MSVFDDPGLQSRRHAPGGPFQDRRPGHPRPESRPHQGRHPQGPPHGREPVKERKASNGHGRGGSQEAATAHIGNLVIEAAKTSDSAGLKEELIRQAKAFGLSYGIIIRRMGDESGRGDNDALAAPLLVYKARVQDGGEELYRNAQFMNVTSRALRDIALASKTQRVHNYYQLALPLSRARSRPASSTPTSWWRRWSSRRPRRSRKSPGAGPPYFAVAGAMEQSRAGSPSSSCFNEAGSIAAVIEGAEGGHRRARARDHRGGRRPPTDRRGTREIPGSRSTGTRPTGARARRSKQGSRRLRRDHPDPGRRLEYDPPTTRPWSPPSWRAGRTRSRLALRPREAQLLRKAALPFFTHYIGNLAIIFLTNTLYGRRATDYEGAYKAFRREVVAPIPIEAEGFEFDNELVCKLFRMSRRVVEVPISYHPRSYEEGKKISWRHGLCMIWSILKWRVKPL